MRYRPWYQQTLRYLSWYGVGAGAAATALTATLVLPHDIAAQAPTQIIGRHPQATSASGASFLLGVCYCEGDNKEDEDDENPSVSNPIYDTA